MLKLIRRHSSVIMVPSKCFAFFFIIDMSEWDCKATSKNLCELFFKIIGKHRYQVIVLDVATELTALNKN